MDTDKPICVVHLKVERSDDIEIEREAIRKEDIKNERLTNMVYIKQEHDIDIEETRLISTKDIKQEQIEIDIKQEETDIQTYTVPNVVEIKQEQLHEIDNPKDGLISVKDIKKEVVEVEIDIGINRFTNDVGSKLHFVEKEHTDSKRKELLENNKKYAETQNIKSKGSKKGAAPTVKRPRVRKKAFECDACGRLFTRKYFPIHFRTHTGEKPFKCDICKCRFTRRSFLNSHIRTHTGETPFVCMICKRKFNLKHYLDGHLRTHTGDKPFECEVCHKRFGQNSTLNTHLRTHTGEKPYECEVCLQRFRQKSTLNTHLRTHNGEKPYECKVCHQKFTSQSNLNRHLKTHTAKKAILLNTQECEKTSMTLLP